MDKKRTKSKGVTLLELIIALGLISLVITLIFSFVNMTQKKSKELDIKQELQHDGTIITESMMKNILEAESIDIIEQIEPVTKEEENNLKSISFEFNEEGYLSNDSGIFNVDKIKYQVDGRDLNLYFHIKHKSLDAKGAKCSSTHWKKIQTISRNIKELRLENKLIKEMWSTGKDEALIKKIIKEEKSVNLKIILEGKDYDKTIEHEHTIELSLRNAK